MFPDLQRVLYSAGEIEAKVTSLGEQISRDYANKGQLVAVGILKGSAIFMADLVRKISLPVTLDFMVVSSYGHSSSSSGVIQIKKDLVTSIQDRHVLIIEDIVDTGLTLYYLKKDLLARNPASLKICSLLDKPEKREKQVAVEYLGFQVPDEFLVGYGLDYAECYRNLPDIWVLRAEAIETNR